SHFVAAVQRYARQSLTGGAQAHQVEVIDGQPYQIVATPVRAPGIVGWVGMGFPVGESLLKDMHTLSGLDVVLMLRAPLGDWSVSQSTLERAQWNPVAAAWQSPMSGSSGADNLSLMVEGDEFSGHQVILPRSEEHTSELQSRENLV